MRPRVLQSSREVLFELTKKNLENKMSAIGLKRNKIQKLKDFIDQNNSSKNIKFQFGANNVDFKESEFENDVLNGIAEKLIKQLEKDIESLD